MIQSQPDSASHGAAELQADPTMASSTQGQVQPEMVLRRGIERFHSQTGWLDSWHSFSFAGHFDPRWCGFGPLLVINDDRIAAGQGFGMHPHRDMEIITVMVEGSLNHRDSIGHSATLRAGEVQRMSAGTGIVHSEINGSPDPCRLLQIWIEPSRPGLAPSYDQRPYPQTPGWTALIDPEGRAGAMAIQRPVRLWRACPVAAGRLDVDLQPGSLGWLQVIAGSLAVHSSDDWAAVSEIPSPLVEGDGLGFSSGQIASLTAGSKGADLLLFELY
jgi:redox-sensitive bicupin YhaK (pirin superfamily)